MFAQNERLYACHSSGQVYEVVTSYPLWWGPNGTPILIDVSGLFIEKQELKSPTPAAAQGAFLRELTVEDVEYKLPTIGKKYGSYVRPVLDK